MSVAAPVPDAPVASVAEAIARMEAIDAALPATDGVACFNHMYLAVAQQVNSQISGAGQPPAAGGRLSLPLSTETAG